MFWIILALFWIVSGYIAGCMNFYYYQTKYSDIALQDYQEDLRLGRLFALLGPISLGKALFAFKSHYGLKDILCLRN